MQKARFYISPYFVFKRQLLMDLEKVAGKYRFTGSLLDIGCGEKPYKKLFPLVKYIGIDFNKYSKNKDISQGRPDYYFDKSYLENGKLPFKSSSFNVVTLFQVLEHVKFPSKTLAETSRVLKSGGYVILTFPFLWPMHEAPHDYFRYTEYGIRELVSNLELKQIEIIRQGSVFSAISIIMNEYLSNFASKNKLNYIISIISYPLFLIFQYVSIILDKVFKSDTIFTNYLIILQKC